MAMGVEKAAKGLISGKKVTEGTLNMVEMTFRAYDPCHACATHSLPGSMPLVLHLRDLRGNTLAMIRRDGNGKIHRE
jgi:F420-non-reducing hydrogenase large subunit